MKISDINTKQSLDISKELEVENFKMLQNLQESYLKKDFKNWINDNEDTNVQEDDYVMRNGNNTQNKETQFRSFQNIMIILYVCGQILGINPVSGMLGRDLSKISFKIYSWKFLYSLIIAIAQTIAMCLCWYRLLISPISIGTLAFMSFYSSIWCTTIVFFKIASKWSNLSRAVFNCNLDDYVNPSISKRVRIVCILFLVIALVEHLLSILTKVTRVLDCTNYENGVYEEFMKLSFPWFYNFDVLFNIPMAISIQFINIIATLNWTYSDLFIVCMSLYLTSILNEINKKINWAVNKNYLSSSNWAQLREDYTHATSLVKLFDEVFSGLTLISFASNLFFICLQLFNILTNGLHLHEIVKENCPHYPSWPFSHFGYPVYLCYSLIFLILRFLTVSIVAANVNIASLNPARALYRIPSNAYNKEVQRFVEQIHGDTVALSGLNFFNITREVVLSVAGTIITYELVLLQLDDDDIPK